MPVSITAASPILLPTYIAASADSFTAAASTAPFFAIYGSSTKTLRVLWVKTQAGIGTLDFNDFGVKKYSTAISGGTSANLVQVPLDSGFAAATASICKQYTAAPTAGTLVGSVGYRIERTPSSTAAAAGITPEITFTWADTPTKGIVLRGTGEGIGLVFTTAPAAGVVLGVTVCWTEEAP